MPTQVDIANAALARLAAASIGSLADNSPQARAINRLYTPVLTGLLAARWWSFATGRETLTPTSITPPFPWTAQYTLPTLCLKPRWVTVVASGEMGMMNDDWVPYEVALETSTGSITGRVINTNASPAILVFTTLVTDPTYWEPAFMECFTLQLAAEACFPVTGNVQLGQAMRQAAAQAIEAIEPPGKSAGTSQMQRGSERAAVR